MKNNLKYFIVFIIVTASLFSCKKNNNTKFEHAFYYWKTNDYCLSEGELNQLKTQQIQKLYVKFFEVQADEIFGTIPIAKNRLSIIDYTGAFHDSILSKTLSNLNIIPTIFIKNNVFYHCSNGSLDSLADNIVFLTNKYYDDNFKFAKPNFNEIQIDCDWTAKTKNNYFYLLKAIKILSAKYISCTLRMYPYKYPEIMGVPPVDKATLMCYNLIHPFENENKNSILDTKELESYLKNVKKYLIHLDIALPIFSWMQVYQNNQLIAMINPNEKELQPALKQIKPLWFELQKDIVLDNLFLREGDKIKLEEITEKNIHTAIALLKKHFSFDETTTITLFHLDEKNLKNYSHETLSSFYTDFNK